ncbi:unnamed protein product [Schistosoma curassoni]|uniref:Uncharacterized protein n=1 Tax=Schistosoma curassoni TaxID=6186 RepID=A0A183KWG9_9TREM|nr:unnamed protein product [Schistosoma curassoni]
MQMWTYEQKLLQQNLNFQMFLRDVHLFETLLSTQESKLMNYQLIMMVEGSRQETVNPNFVLLGTRQQGVPVILRELVLPGGFDLVSIKSKVVYR